MIYFSPINKIPDIDKNLYKVTNQGKVFSCKRKIFLKTNINNSGYEYVILSCRRKTKNLLVHRLVMLHFTDVIKDKPHVNHKDENKLNNNLTNLEWTDRISNLNYGTINNRMSQIRKKPVEQYDKQGNLIREFESALEPQLLKIASSAIYHCLNGNNKSHRGFIWKYKNKNKNEY